MASFDFVSDTILSLYFVVIIFSGCLLPCILYSHHTFTCSVESVHSKQYTVHSTQYTTLTICVLKIGNYEAPRFFESLEVDFVIRDDVVEGTNVIWHRPESMEMRMIRPFFYTHPGGPWHALLLLGSWAPLSLLCPVCT